MKNKNLMRIFAWVALVAFLGISILSIVPIGTHAATAQERLNNAQKQQAELKKKLEANKGKKSAEQQNKDLLDSQAAEIEAEINALDAQIDEINNRIEQKDAELAEAHERSSQQFQAYKNRVKLIIEKGSITYIEILAKAHSLEDFFIRMDVMEQIAEYDNELLTSLKESEQIIQALKIEIENERAQVSAIMEETMAKRRLLAEKQAASQKILDELSQSDKEINAEMKKLRQEEDAARSEIARLVSGDTTRYVGGKFLWPSATSYRITSPFSMRVHPVFGVYKQHTGIDIAASHGTNVLAAEAGTVIVSGWNNGYGNYIVINHGGGISTLYGHNSSLLVSKGQKVTKGQVIAKVGSTGYSTGPHIHFEVQINGVPVNPMSYLQ